MTTDSDISEFLEHFGVKGQKWGVRKNPSVKTGEKSNRNRNLKIAATISVGAVFAAVFLAKNGRTKVHDYGYSNSTIDIGPMGLAGRRFGLDN